MPSIKHTHIYVFYERKNGIDYYKCDDPHCTHYAPKTLIKDKASVCSQCRRVELILNKETLRRRRPKCPNCANTKEAREFRRTKDVMAEILDSLK